MEMNQLTIHLTNLEAEIAILGSIFLKNELMDEIFVKEEYFYDTRHKKIMWLMNQMKLKEMDIDAFTLLTFAAEKRLVEDIGGMKYITETVHVPTATNFKYYQNVILELYKKREQVKIAQTILNEVLEEESSQTSLKAFKAIEELNNLGEQKRTVKHISEVMNGVYENLVDHDDKKNGANTHFKHLDSIMGGLRKQDLIIIGARPSMGKTAFAMNIAQNHAIKNEGVVIVFSIEMPNSGLGTRIMSSETLIDSYKFKNPDKSLDTDDWRKIITAMGELSETKMYLTDESTVTTSYIRREVANIVKKHHGEHVTVLIDYLQLIQGDKAFKGNKNLEVADISRNLKMIARDFDCTMIALSQLSRGVEQRQDKHPMMSDIRDSGSIEQDADVIAFLYRDDYYDKESEYKNMIEVIIAKNRQGEVGTATLGFKKELSKFVNIEYGGI